MMLTNHPTVFVVEDDPVICKSLHWLCESVNLSVEVFHDAFSYLRAHDPNRYGCLLIDIRLPGMSGLKLQEELVQRKNPIPVIIITGHGDITLAVRAMKQGARDFILKPFNNDQLLEQIQKVLAESQEKQSVYQQYSNRISHLTAREREIMELVVSGNLSKQIAHQLGIALSTVEQHRSHIMQKMQVKSLAELVKINVLVQTEKSI